MKKIITVFLAVVGLYTLVSYASGVYANWSEERENSENWSRLCYVETEYGATEIEYYVPTKRIFEVSMNDAFDRVNEGTKTFVDVELCNLVNMTAEAKGL